MAVRKLNFKQYQKSLDTLSARVLKAIQARWTIQTVQALDDAKEKAPFASGDLIRSGSFKKASISRRGIESRIVFTAPYASRLNDPKSGLRLKNKGEVSYRIAGKDVIKVRKGELGYLDKAVDENEPNFLNLVKKSVNESW